MEPQRYVCDRCEDKVEQITKTLFSCKRHGHLTLYQVKGVEGWMVNEPEVVEIQDIVMSIDSDLKSQQYDRKIGAHFANRANESNQKTGGKRK